MLFRGFASSDEMVTRSLKDIHLTCPKYAKESYSFDVSSFSTNSSKMEACPFVGEDVRYNDGVLNTSNGSLIYTLSQISLYMIGKHGCSAGQIEGSRRPDRDTLAGSYLSVAPKSWIFLKFRQGTPVKLYS